MSFVETFRCLTVVWHKKASVLSSEAEALEIFNIHNIRISLFICVFCFFFSFFVIHSFIWLTFVVSHWWAFFIFIHSDDLCVNIVVVNVVFIAMWIIVLFFGADCVFYIHLNFNRIKRLIKHVEKIIPAQNLDDEHHFMIFMTYNDYLLKYSLNETFWPLLIVLTIVKQTNKIYDENQQPNELIRLSLLNFNNWSPNFQSYSRAKSNTYKNTASKNWWACFMSRNTQFRKLATLYNKVTNNWCWFVIVTNISNDTLIVTL